MSAHRLATDFQSLDGFEMFLERWGMQTGIIRRRGDRVVIGRWRADGSSIDVETQDPLLRSVSDRILHTSKTIPVHGAARFEFATSGEPLIEAPSTIKYLALFALELEEQGFEMEPDED